MIRGEKIYIVKRSKRSDSLSTIDKVEEGGGRGGDDKERSSTFEREGERNEATCQSSFKKKKNKPSIVIGCLHGSRIIVSIGKKGKARMGGNIRRYQ